MYARLHFKQFTRNSKNTAENEAKINWQIWTKISNKHFQQPSDHPETTNQEKPSVLSRWRREPLSLKRSISPAFSSFRRKSKRTSVRSFKSVKLSATTTTSALTDSKNTTTLAKYQCPTSNSMQKLQKGSFEERRVGSMCFFKR